MNIVGIVGIEEKFVGGSKLVLEGSEQRVKFFFCFKQGVLDFVEFIEIKIIFGVLIRIKTCKEEIQFKLILDSLVEQIIECSVEIIVGNGVTEVDVVEIIEEEREIVVVFFFIIIQVCCGSKQRGGSIFN